MSIFRPLRSSALTLSTLLESPHAIAARSDGDCGMHGSADERRDWDQPSGSIFRRAGVWRTNLPTARPRSVFGFISIGWTSDSPRNDSTLSGREIKQLRLPLPEPIWRHVRLSRRVPAVLVAGRRIVTDQAVDFGPLTGRRAPSPRSPLPHLPRFALDREFQRPTPERPNSAICGFKSSACPSWTKRWHGPIRQ